MTHPVLSNPPIQEAIATVHFAEELGKKTINKFVDNQFVKEHYNLIKQPNLRFAINMPADPAKAGVEVEDTVDSYLAYSIDKQRIALQIRPDSLSVHILKDYKQFDELMSVFYETWLILSQSDLEAPVRKIGLRYVNKIAGKPTTDRFNLYLKTPFDDESLNNVFVQLRVNHTSDQRVFALITQAVQAVEKSEDASTILDINVQMEIEPVSSHEVDLDAVFSTLRSFKNDLFFSAVTQVVVAPYL